MAKKNEDPVEFTPDKKLTAEPAKTEKSEKADKDADPPKPELVATPDPEALKAQGITPTANVIITPKPVAPAQSEPEDPDKKMPEHQINTPAPPPLDPKQQRFPSDAVPVGEEYRTPAANEQGARAAFEGKTVEEYVKGQTGESEDTGKKAKK